MLEIAILLQHKACAKARRERHREELIRQPSRMRLVMSGLHADGSKASPYPNKGVLGRVLSCFIRCHTKPMFAVVQLFGSID